MWGMGAWGMGYGVCNMVYGLWCIVYRVSCMVVYDVWCMWIRLFVLSSYVLVCVYFVARHLLEHDLLDPTVVSNKTGVPQTSCTIM